MSHTVDDFLDESGQIDTTELRRVQNGINGSGNSVSERECRRIRRVAHETTASSGEIARAFDLSKTTVRRHLKDCHHSLDLPTLRYANNADGWTMEADE